MNKILRLIGLIVYFVFLGVGGQAYNTVERRSYTKIHKKDAATSGPVITATAVKGSIFACEGNASLFPNIQQFTIDGSQLTADITVTAPAGFEVSLTAGNGYGNLVTVPQSGGAVSNKVIYVRSSASALGSISGNVVLSTAGAADQNVTVNGLVNLLPTVNTVPDQVKANGQSTDAINFTGTSTLFNWENDRPDIGLGASGVGNIASFIALNASNSAVTATIKVTPQPVDFAYVPNYTSNTVSVINTSDNSLVTTIPVGTNPVGVAVSKDGSRVYITNNGSNNISVINTATYKVINTIPVSVNPYGIAVSDDGKWVYVVNKGIATVSIINTATGASSAIAVSNGPAGIVVTPDGSKVYITSYDTDRIYCLTVANGLVTDFPVNHGPFGIAVSPDGKRIYVTNELEDKLTVINTANNHVILLTWAGGQNPFGIAMAPDGNTVYVTYVGENKVRALDPLTLQPKAVYDVGSYPYGISVSADSKFVYAANVLSNNVSVISAEANAVIKTIAVQQSPYSFGSFITSSGCAGIPKSFKITVNPTAPSFTTGIVTGSITGCFGSPSAYPNVQQFTVAGNNLSSDIVVTAPAGFEVSAAEATGYGSSAILNQLSGAVSGRSIYVRSAATATGTITGNITLSTLGLANKTVTVKGIVDALPLANTVPGQVKNSGEATDAVTFTGTGNTFTWINDKPSIGLPATGSGDIPSFTALNGTSTPVTTNIIATPQLVPMAYVANSGAGTVSVINTLTGKVVKVIDVGPGPLCIAISADGSKVYLPNPSQKNIQVISTSTNTVTDVILTGEYVVGIIMLSPDGKRLYATTESYAILDINIATGKVESAIPVDTHYPGFFVFSPAGDKIYLLEAQKMVTISTVTHSQIGSVNVALQPSGIAISADGSKIYVTNIDRDNVYVLDAQTNAVLTIIDVGSLPYNLTFSPDGGTLYVSNFESGTVSVINTQTDKVVNIIPVGVGPIGLSVTADGSKLYVTNANSRSVSVVELATGKIIKIIDVQLSPISYGYFITHGGQCSGQPIKFTITVNGNSTAIATSGVSPALATIYSEASASKNFNVSGVNLKAGILITPPTGFEVSTDNANFFGNLTVGAAGTLASTTVYIRLKGHINAGSYAGNVVLGSTGAADVNMPVTGIVAPAALIIKANAVHKAYGSTLTGPVTSNAFTQTGLQNAEVVGSITVTYGQGAAATDAVNTYPGALTASAATGGTFVPANYIITYLPGDIIVDAVPLITVSGNLIDLTTTYGTASKSTVFTVAGSDLTEGILVTPPAGYEVSTDNSHFTNTVIAGGAGNTSPVNVYVRLSRFAEVGSYPGVVSLSSTGAPNSTVSMQNGTVSKAPLTITANNVFKTYGDELNGGAGITSFTSIGLQNSEVISSVAVTYTAGFSLNDNAGTYAGAVVPSSATGTFKTNNYDIIYKNADVIAGKATLTIAAIDKTKNYGSPNPTLDVSYSGFKNGETASQLLTPPLVTTPALIFTPIGQYPIKANGAGSLNYDFIYVDGVLTIEAVDVDIIIPNTFSPNGDGANDSWVIKNLEKYPNYTVDVYNRYGERLYSSIGYSIPWDGKYKGNELPPATYYYIINPKNGRKLISGPVTIIR